MARILRAYPGAGGLNMSQLADSDMSSVAQGDLIYRNGSSKWANLAAGTSGQALVSGGAGANPSWGSTIGGVQLTGGEVVLDSGDSSGAGVVRLKDDGSGTLEIRDGDDSEYAPIAAHSVYIDQPYAGSWGGFFRGVAENIVGVRNADDSGYGGLFVGSVSASTQVTTNTIGERLAGSGVTIDGVLCKDGEVVLDSDDSSGAGVVRLKDDGSGGLSVRDQDDTDDANIKGGAIVAVDRLNIGGVSASDVRLNNSAGVLAVRKGDNSAAAGLTALSLIASTTATVGTLVTNTISESDVETGVTVDGVLLKDGYVRIAEVSEPSDPADGKAILWLSSDESTGSTLGDVMIKITVGGTTKTATLASFNDL